MRFSVTILPAIAFVSAGLSAAPPAKSLIDGRGDRGEGWHRAAVRQLHGEDERGADGPMRKATWDLIALSAQRRKGLRLQMDDNLPMVGDDILIEAVFEDVVAGEQGLKTLGLKRGASCQCLVSGQLAIDQLPAAAALPGLRILRPSYRSRSVGSVTSQGDVAAFANLARLLPPGFDGSGITIGTLSDSYDTALSPITNAAADVLSGDLPSGIVVLDELGGAGSDEGRAMMQLIADIVPGADQKFHTAFEGQASFAQGILDLQAAGCDIIVDDVFYFSEPFFQDGVIAQAVDAVTALGVPYFSSAGNSGRDSYDSLFSLSSSGTTGLKGGQLHDFDPGPGDDVAQSVTVPVGATLRVILQWDQPFFSVSGAPGCANDIDLLLTGSGAGSLSVLGVANANNVGGDAVEIIQFTNNGSIDVDGIVGPDTSFNLVIEVGAVPNPGRLKYLFSASGGTVTVNEYLTNSSTVVGHANAASAVAVGASAYFNSPAFGLSPAVLNSFSSAGGTPILFDLSGAPLGSPESRGKPDLVGPDGGNTTFFGSDIEPDGFPNFFGTSAAAPHVSAVAALLMQRAGGPGSLTPAEVRVALTTTARDMGPAGFDDDTGFGFVDAEEAMMAVPLDYDFWTQLAFTGGTPAADMLPEADPDGDGLYNLGEYYLGRNPLEADAPTVALMEDGSSDLIASFDRAKIAPVDLGTLQYSFNLSTWTDFAGAVEEVGSTAELISQEANLGPLVADETFVRLKIEEQE